MVDDTPPAEAGTADLRPYDYVRLIPAAATRLGVGPGVLLTVADIVDNAPGVVEVNHQQDHPDYMDWAAAVTAADVAVVIRVTGSTAHTWNPRP